MKKKLKCLIVVLIISASSIVAAHADPYLGTGYAFTSSASGVINVGWDALSAMCAECNRDMKAGYFGTGAVNDSCRIVWGSVGGSTGWFISRINQSGSYTNTYLGNSANNLVYYSAYATYDQLSGISSVLSNISSYVNTIRSSCQSIQSSASTISSNITNILAGLNYMISHWGNNYYCSYSEYGDPAQPYPVHPVPKITGDIMLANVNDHIGDKITYISEAGQESTYLIVGAGYNQYNYLQVTIENTSQTQTYSVYLCDSKRNMFKANTETWQSGSGSGSGSSSSYDDTNLLAMLNTLGQKIDRIYDWLDNADLSTNQTIINMVNDSTQDITDALPNFNQVNSLFRAAFSPTKNGHQTSDWTSAFSYFTHLWSD